MKKLEVLKYKSRIWHCFHRLSSLEYCKKETGMDNIFTTYDPRLIFKITILSEIRDENYRCVEFIPDKDFDDIISWEKTQKIDYFTYVKE